MCLTSDINGYVQDLREGKYTFDVKPESIAWIQEHGIRFTLLLPVNKPGAYTVHVSVHDTESGKVGSAYQFVEIPDLKKKGLELSDIFIINSADDLNWMRSDVLKEIAKGVFSPTFQVGEVRSPALRTYASGDRFPAMAMLYNADMKAINRQEIEIQSIIYKDGVEILRGKPSPVERENMENTEGIPLLCKLTIGSDLPPGDYVLQLLATDKKHSRKRDEEGGVFSENQGIFSKILRAYLSEDKNYTNNGVATKTLFFKVTDNFKE